MVTTSYAVGDALAVKLWQREMAHEVPKGIEWASLIGTNANAIVHQKTELKDTGDQVTFGLRTHLVGAGKTENETLEGNEESMSTYSDAILVNELDHAVRVKNKDTIDAQRVPFDLREEARMGLTDWYAERGSLWMFAQLSGYTGLTMTYRGVSTTMSAKYRGNNTVTAPSTNRKLFGGSGLTTDQGVNADSTATFNLNLIDKAKEKAMLANPRIRPVRINGKDMYVIYIHPIQTYDLRTTTSDGQWFDIQRAKLMGGDGEDNPIISGSLGVYNNVIIRESEDVVPGVHSTTSAEQTSVRRALFLGAQAGCFAQSSRYSKNSPYKWVEKMFNYDKELGISVQSIMGLKKTIFNSEDYGVITISTYAAAHT
jgi:N4-gp56 family major capsid protein